MKLKSSLAKILLSSCLILSIYTASIKNNASVKVQNNAKTDSSNTNTEKMLAENKGDILGGASNYDKENKSAITYGLGDIGAYTLPKELDNVFKKPTFVPKLPDKFELPTGGPLENIDEVPTTTDYYDGSINLNKIKISCRIYGNANDCLKNTSCGWCGSNNSCILGNNLGPLQSCVRHTFVYSTPTASFDQTLTVNQNSEGVSFNLSENQSQKTNQPLVPQPPQPTQ